MCGPMRVPCRGEALDSNWTTFPKHKSRLYSVTASRSALASHEGGSIFARLLSSGSTLKRPPCLAKNKIRCWSSGLNCVTPSRSNGPSSTGGNRTHDNLLRRQRRRCASTVFTDRKSTRLNSSHLGISYAVFCFEKKKVLLSTESETHTPESHSIWRFRCLLA